MSREVERPPRPLVPVTLYGLVAAIVAERLVMAGDPPGRTLVIVALTCGGLTLTGCLLATAREGWDLRREQAVDEARGIVVTCLCCAALAVTSAGIGRARMEACADALAARPVSRVELVVCGDPSPGEWSFSYVANVRISGRVVGRVTLTCDEELSRGQVLGCVGRFSRAGGDEWGRSCRQRGICGSVRCVSVIAVEGPAGPLSPILRARDALVEYVCPGRSEARAVLAGIVLGRRSELAERGIDEDFSRSGLAHLVAVSGTHIAIVSAALAELLERLRARPFPRFVALAAAGLAYVLLCGAPASALRAWLMSVSAGGALVAGRRDHALSSVALAGLGMCIADPGTAGELGFVLSVSCVCAISAFAGYASYALESLLSGIRLPHLPAQVRRRVEGMTDDVRGTVAMAVVAQAASAPLVAGTFGRLSVLGPVSCLVAGPAFLACMCLGLPAVILAPAPVFGEVLLMVADVPCWLLVHVARTVGRVPLARPRDLAHHRVRPAVALRERRGLVGRQRVDAAADVRPCRIRRKPGSLRNADHAFHDPAGDVYPHPDASPVIPDLCHIPFPQLPGRGILRMDPQPVRLQLFHAHVVVMDGMAAPLCVPPDQLQRIFFPLCILAAFECRLIPGNGRHIRQCHAGQRRGKDFNLSAFCGIPHLSRMRSLLPECGKGPVLSVQISPVCRKFRKSGQLRFCRTNPVIQQAVPLAHRSAAL